jgi:ribosomal protein L32
MTNSKLQFCNECGSVLEKGKICKKCSPFLSKNLKKTGKKELKLEKKIPQRFFTKKLMDHQQNKKRMSKSENMTL